MSCTHMYKETHTKAHALLCRCIRAPTGTPKGASPQDLNKLQKSLRERGSQKAVYTLQDAPLNALTHS